MGVRPCASLGGKLAIAQSHQPGFGKPIYSQNHLIRQRLSVVRMLCPMCGQPTSVDDRWTQVARRRTVGQLRAAGVADSMPEGLSDNRVLLDAGSITPLHRQCVDRSLKHCPYLKHEAEVKVMRFPHTWFVLPLMVEASEPGGQTVGVVSFLQICGVTDAIDRRSS